MASARSGRVRCGGCFMRNDDAESRSGSWAGGLSLDATDELCYGTADELYSVPELVGAL